MHLTEEDLGFESNDFSVIIWVGRILLILLCLWCGITNISAAIASAVTPLHCLSSSSPGAPNCRTAPSPGSTPDARLGNRYVGNPIDVVTGNKYQREDDFLSLSGDLAFIRHYNSALDAYDTGLGPGWRHTYQVVLSKFAQRQLQVIQSDGRALIFTQVDGTEMPAVYKAEVATDGVLVAGSDTRWFVPDGRRFQFHGSYLVAIESPVKKARLSLRYRDGRLNRVMDQYGQALHFDYADVKSTLPQYGTDALWIPPGALARVRLPDQSNIEFAYDGFRRLTKVTYPDNRSNEQSTHYAYENPDFAQRLTMRKSTVDQRESRWSYDEQGRAQSWSEHDRGSGLSIDYGVDNGEAGFSEAIVTYSDNRTEQYRWTGDTNSDKPEPVAVKMTAAGLHNHDPVNNANNAFPGDYIWLFKYDSGNRWTVQLTDTNDAATLTASVDRLGKVLDLQVGRTKLSKLAGEFLNGSLAECTQAVTNDTDTSSKAHRIATLVHGTSPCSDDVLVLLALANRLEKGRLDLTPSSVSGREFTSRRFQSKPVDHFCTMPPGKSCDDLIEDRDMAELSRCAYANSPCRVSFQQISPSSIGLSDDQFDIDGFNAVLFYDPGRDRYTLAFRGTDKDGDDWETNVAQGKGERARQYDLAYQLAKDVVRNLRGKNVNFTGHSLGGGLATLAALATNREATIFNSAALHPNNAIRYGVQPQYENANTNIDHLSTMSDPLTNAQDFAARWSIYGTQVVPGQNTEIPDPYDRWMDSQKQHLSFLQGTDSLLYHSMAAVLESINTLIAKQCSSAP